MRFHRKRNPDPKAIQLVALSWLLFSISSTSTTSTYGFLQPAGPVRLGPAHSFPSSSTMPSQIGFYGTPKSPMNSSKWALNVTANPRSRSNANTNSNRAVPPPPLPNSSDPYRVLNIDLTYFDGNPKAVPKIVIKRAYRRSVFLYHPDAREDIDANSTKEERDLANNNLARINGAYTALTNKAKDGSGGDKDDDSNMNNAHTSTSKSTSARKEYHPWTRTAASAGRTTTNKSKGTRASTSGTGSGSKTANRRADVGSQPHHQQQQHQSSRNGHANASGTVGNSGGGGRSSGSSSSNSSSNSSSTSSTDGRYYFDYEAAGMPQPASTQAETQTRATSSGTNTNAYPYAAANTSKSAPKSSYWQRNFQTQASTATSTAKQSRKGKHPNTRARTNIQPGTKNVSGNSQPQPTRRTNGSFWERNFGRKAKTSVDVDPPKVKVKVVQQVHSTSKSKPSSARRKVTSSFSGSFKPTSPPSRSGSDSSSASGSANTYAAAYGYNHAYAAAATAGKTEDPYQGGYFEKGPYQHQSHNQSQAKSQSQSQGYYESFSAPRSSTTSRASSASSYPSTSVSSSFSSAEQRRKYGDFSDADKFHAQFGPQVRDSPKRCANSSNDQRRTTMNTNMNMNMNISANSISDRLAGVVLLAPMLALNVAEPLRYVLKGLSFLVPTIQLISSSATSSAKQYRDADKRRECDDDDLTVSGAKLRVASAAACVNLAAETRASLSDVDIPFLCMVANEDVVVKNEGSFELMEKSPSLDKTLKQYDALHGLFCEPAPLIDQIQLDLLSWVNHRCKN